MKKRLISLVTAAALFMPTMGSMAVWADEPQTENYNEQVVEQSDNAAVELLSTTANGTCGDNLTWKLDSDGTLTISGTGNMTDWSSSSSVPWYSSRSSIKNAVINSGVTSIGEGAFAECSLTSIEIPDSVTSIGYNAFYYCRSLESVVIPDSVTSIGGSAFYNCSSLESVVIPDSVTSIGNWAFGACSSLESVVIPDSVTSIGDDAFRGCSSLESVVIPDSVTSIGDDAFDGCSSLGSVVIPDSVTSIGSCAFKDCSSLGSVVIPDSVTSIGNYAFRGCSSLESVVIPDSVTSIGNWAFGECSSLESVVIPDSVTSIGDMAFYYCSSLTSISVDINNQYYSSENGNLFNKDKTTIIQYAIGKTDTQYTIPDNVTSIGDFAFSWCSSLTSIEIPDSVTSIGGRAFGYCSSLESVTIGNSVTSIGDFAFYYCSSLTDVYYGGSENEWEAISIGSCNTPLTNAVVHYAYAPTPTATPVPTPTATTIVAPTPIAVPTEVPTEVPTASPTVVQTTAPTAVPTASSTLTPTASPTLTPIPTQTAEPTSTPKPTEKPTPGPVTSGTDGSISWNFVSGELTISGTGAIPDYSVGTAPWYHLRGEINKITIQQGINTIGENAFNGLANVTDISIPIGVNQINNGAFEGCGKLKTITLPESMNAGIGSGAFRDCTGITTITVPSGVKTIEQGAFEGCTNITEITLPFIGSQVGSANNTDTFDYIFNGKVPSILKKVTITNETNVPENAFKDLSDIENITINSGIKSIGNGAFDGCSALKQFVIPAGITAIGDNIFRSCESAVTITVPDTVTSIGEAAFDGCTKLKAVNIPDGIAYIDNYTFRNCASLTKIEIPTSVISIGESVLEGCTRIIDLKIPFVGVNTDPASTKDSEDDTLGYLFGCANSDIPAAVTRIEITSTERSNYIPKEAFKDCGFIEDIIIDGGRAILDNAFANCKNLKNLYIPKSTSNIGKTILADCTRLETLTVPFIGISNSDNNTETSVLEGFFGYNDQDIAKGTMQYYDGVNYHLYKVPKTLKNVSVLSQTDIPTGAFSECDFIEKVAVVKGASMGDKAFYHCVSLKTVTLPNDLQSIGMRAFAECESLENINIPTKVKSIGEQAFYNDRALKNVIIPDSVIQIADDVFNGTDLFSAVNLMANSRGRITCSQDSTAYNYAVAKGIQTNVVSSSELNVKKTSTTVVRLSDNSFLFDITDSYNMNGILHVELYDNNGSLASENTRTANDVEYRVEFSAADMSDVAFAKIYVTDEAGNMVSTQVEIISAENGEIPEIPESNVEMVYENGIITFTGTMIKPVVLLQAIYNDNGSLNKVNTYPVVNINDEIETEESDKSKFMLWESMESMKPITDCISVE